MRRTFGAVILGVLVAGVAAAGAQETQLGTGTMAGATALANQVNDPTAPITLLQSRTLFLPAWSGSSGGATVTELELVFPIAKGRLIPLSQLSRLTVPYLWIPDALGGVAGVGDFSYFNIGLIKAKWGRWGPGVALVIPTGASTTALTSGKWQLGPAFGVILTTVPNLQFGLVFQNPISFAGPSERPAVNALSIQPTLTYNFPEGWFAGLSDFSFSFDWTDGGAATIPIGVQVGKVAKIGRRHFVLSAEGGKLLAVPGAQDPEWIIGLEAAWIIELHPGLQ